ncbi:MAG: nucleotidyltransferase family protein [Balneolaceae bacterium]|nr:nucleotidyltransferase family protein [Balneolaceae bacterium]
MNASAESPFPNSNQQLLLKAALMGRDPAIEAWKTWRKHVDFELDVDGGSLRLLPLAYNNIKKLGVEDDILNRLKGIYRRAWSENQRIIYECGNVLKLFKDAGIETIVLKGIPLTIRVYENYATRPMADMDILVPYVNAAEAVDLLKKQKFIVENENRLNHNLIYGRSIGFSDETKDIEVDLHWRAISQAKELSMDHLHWKNAIPLKLNGLQTKSLSPTDELLLTIAHGMRRNPEPPIRWVADSIMLIRKEHSKIDWDRLLDLSIQYREFLKVKKAFEYLEKVFGVRVPNMFTEQVKRLQPTFAEKVIYSHEGTIGVNKKNMTFTERVYSFYARFLRQSGRSNFFMLHIDFMIYTGSRIKKKMT